jgi:hypothetical protein
LRLRKKQGCGEKSHPFPQHVVISILQHLVGRIVTLEGNEPETTGLVVVWVTHNEYLNN